MFRCVPRVFWYPLVENYYLCPEDPMDMGSVIFEDSSPVGGGVLCQGYYDVLRRVPHELGP